MGNAHSTGIMQYVFPGLRDQVWDNTRESALSL